ncbi:MAG TPA: ATP-dependent Clp protease ATP-binding subunit ClpX, partial [Candidatus Ligilactobacillus excrementipullorum]|nr:ATP-dependent Clp protease ATP-binding subunit ClpX [Candidatus Ligilactobacillus excrementipullorum]
MYENMDGNGPVTCSFCGKSESQVKSMISGPGVYICNECVALAQSIMDEETKSEVQHD